MEAFLERYYNAIDLNLGDPHASTRYPRSDRLSDLHDIDLEIFEKLLNVSLMESAMGYAEATITLQNGESFYMLPEGCRQFLSLQKRVSGRVTEVIRSGTFYESRYTAEVLSGTRGIRLYPAPTLSSDENWTLVYQRSPPTLHYAKASSVDGKYLVTGTPDTDSGAGEVVLIDNYYNGCEVRIFSAGRGAPQQREVEYYSAGSDGRGTFHVRHAWTPTSGEVWYEVCPTVPQRYDSIYAMDAAILALSRRSGNADKIAFLSKQRAKKWSACRSFFASNVSDRGPGKLTPPNVEDFMPTGEVPYDFY